jgi:8-oxo-dGTP pyrophosphatase MutT (NUDIX family)
MLTFRHTGDWGPGDIAVEWTESTRPIIPKVEEAIERAWSDTLNRRPGVHLFDGPMCRLERAAVSPPAQGRRFELVLSQTSYKVFLGTNLTHPHLADRFGTAILANPLGASVLLESSDGWLLLGRRGRSVAYYPDRIHPFAGAVEPRDAGDVFGAALRELREELSLTAADLGHLRCVGLVEDNALRQPELIFHGRCAPPRTELETRVDRIEHRGAWAVRAQPAAIEDAVRDPALTPVAVAALTLYSRR